MRREHPALAIVALIFVLFWIIMIAAALKGA